MITLEELRSKANIATFKAMNARQQRKAIEDFYKRMPLETANFVTEWTKDYAYDLLDESAEFVTCFDLWFVTTVIYDIDLPNDLPECIAEGDSPQPWRNFLTRHGLPWRRWTKADLEDVGAVALL